MNLNVITRSVGRAVLKTKKNSPHIFFGVGAIGVIGSTFLACRSTLKLEETVDEVKKDVEDVRDMANRVKDSGAKYTEEDFYKDLGYVYIKSVLKVARLYGPSILLGGASIAALTGSHIQLTRRNAALTVTLAAVTKAYETYRERVSEELGKERELELYHGIRDEAIDANGKKEAVKVADANGHSIYSRFFDEYNTNWTKDPEMNRIFIQCQQNYANHLLQSRGHVFLNDIYDSLGLDRSKAGSIVGWVRKGDGDGYIDFGMFEIRNARFVNQIERSILLDFNVDGVVYDKIEEQ